MTESKAKPKAKRTPRVSKPRKSATKAKSPPKAVAKAKPGAEANRAIENAATRLIDERIRSLGGWRAETLAEVRRLIHEADPDIMEECKWIKPTNPLGVPVWSHAGIVCTGETYNQVVKLTFARGASLEDPRGLFNSSLEGNTRRAIDIRQGELGDLLDAEALKALIQAAVAENLRSSAPKSAVGSRQSAVSSQKSAARDSLSIDCCLPTADCRLPAGASKAKPVKLGFGMRQRFNRLPWTHVRIDTRPHEVRVQRHLGPQKK